MIGVLTSPVEPSAVADGQITVPGRILSTNCNRKTGIGSGVFVLWNAVLERPREAARQ